MQSMKCAPELGALLFVRNADDIHASMQMANELLWRRRPGRLVEGDVFGIVVGTRIDGSLHEPFEDGRVGLHEAVGLSRVWSLCWFELRGMVERRAPASVRRYLLDLLLGGDAGPHLHGSAQLSFLPVIAPSEEREDVGSLFAGIEARYSSLKLIRTLVVDDPMRGGMVSVTHGTTLARPS